MSELTPAPAPAPAHAPPTLFDLVAGTARQVAPSRLALVLRTAGALTVPAFAAGAWPVGVALVGLAAVAGWGLADHWEAEWRAAEPRRARRLRALRVAKCAAALVAGGTTFSLLYAAVLWLSGPAPVF